jgi:hypothetical protein
MVDQQPEDHVRRTGESHTAEPQDWRWVLPLGLCIIGLICSIWALIDIHPTSLVCGEPGRIVNCPLIISPSWSIGGLSVGWLGVLYFVVAGSLNLSKSRLYSGRTLRVIASTFGVGICAYLIGDEPLSAQLHNGAFIAAVLCVLALFTINVTAYPKQQTEADYLRMA